MLQFKYFAQRLRREADYSGPRGAGQKVGFTAQLSELCTRKRTNFGFRKQLP
jgi:hypothetical protein